MSTGPCDLSPAPLPGLGRMANARPSEHPVNGSLAARENVGKQGSTQCHVCLWSACGLPVGSGMGRRRACTSILVVLACSPCTDGLPLSASTGRVPPIAASKCHDWCLCSLFAGLSGQGCRAGRCTRAGGSDARERTGSSAWSVAS